MNSPIPWQGGKRLLKKEVLKRFPEKFGCYAEGFGGGGSVLFELEPRPGRSEVINDVDHDLMNLYTVIKEDKEAFLKAFEYCLISRKQFNQYMEELQKPDLSRVQRAMMFYYTLKLSFGSLRQSYAAVTTSKPGLNLEKLPAVIDAAYDRLRRVYIESLDYKDLIRLYDRPHTLFYLDPPYRKSRRYAYIFKDSDYFQLRDILSGISGRFLMSLNDDPFIRETFKEFLIEPVTVNYSMNRNHSKEGRELFIKNY